MSRAVKEATYTRPETVSDHECNQIILGIVRGMGPMTEGAIAPIAQKAIDMLHHARIDATLLDLVINGKLVISGVQDGELQFCKEGEK